MLSDPTTPMPAEGSGPNGEPFPGRKDEAAKYRQTEADRASARDPEPLRNRNNGEETSLKDPETGELTYAANSTKGMPHNEIGEVIGSFRQREKAYERLLRAVDSENPDDLAGIPTGPSRDIITDQEFRPFVDPQNGIGFALEGPDAPSTETYRGTVAAKQPILLAPRFSEPHLAAEIGEIYLMALSRDVPVNALQGTGPSTDSRVADAVRLMNGFTDYRGPKTRDAAGNLAVTPQTLFRGGNILSVPPGQDQSRNVGELDGPYLSQFIVVGSRVDDGTPPPQLSAGAQGRAPESVGTGIKLSRADGQVLYGTLTIDQRQFEVQPGLDFVTDYDTWLQVLQGTFPRDLSNPNDQSTRFTGQRKFRYSLRQFAEYVHFDQTYQEGLIAALLILSMGERAMRTGQNLFNPGNAYLDVDNQTGFGSFGNGHVLALVAEATTRAVKAAWNQKWFNQRRLRPEVLAGRIHNTVTKAVTRRRYGLNKEISSLDTFPGSELLVLVAKHNQVQNEKNERPTKDVSYLLPQQYPEGSPTHPSYPAGHATQIAAEVTVLKGLFNEDFTITDNQDPALVPNADGTKLGPFTPDPSIKLTLGRELNKLAANVSLARSLAGVHYRLDYSESALLGESVGLGILQEQARSFNQARRSAVSRDDPFFFQLTLFSGITVRVLADGSLVQV